MARWVAALLLVLVASPAWALTAQDTFTRTENPLASGWVSMGATTTPFRANGTDAIGTSITSNNHALYTASAFGSAQFSRVVIGAPGDADGGPMVRASVGTFSGYFMSIHSPPANTFDIRKGNGSATAPSEINVASGRFAAPPSAGDVYEINAVGTAPVVLTVTRNGVPGTLTSGSLTDSTAPLYTGGAPGMYVWHDTMSFASWEGGDMDVTPPEVPTGLTAVGIATTKIQLGWVASLRATSYLIERSAGATCDTFSQIDSTAATAYTVTGLPASTPRCFRVRATNGIAQSGYSNTATATTLGTQNATLAWTDTNTSPNEEGTELWCCDGAGCVPNTQGIRVTTVGPNVTTASYANAPLPVVTCSVIAVSSASGVVSSGFSATWANTPTGLGPAAPTGLVVEPQ